MWFTRFFCFICLACLFRQSLTQQAAPPEHSGGKVDQLRQYIANSPCTVNVNFYPNGQWRLGRGFRVDSGNSLSSSQTHYKPRVFLDCEESLIAEQLGENANVSIVLWSASLSANISDAGSAEDTPWLHWMVVDIPLDCETGSCFQAATSVPGTALQTHKGRLLADYVPPGVAELRARSEDSKADNLYVVAVLSNVGNVINSDSSADNISLPPTSESAVKRAQLLRRSALDGTSDNLLGLNYFMGTVDGMGEMQFQDIKGKTHGIVHSSKLARSSKDEL